MELDHGMIFGQRLKALRERKGLTQTELAEFIGYKNYTTVTKWESGSSLPRGKELKMLSNLFNVSADYLLGLDTIDNKNINTIYTQLTPPRQTKVYDFASRQLEEQENRVVPLVGTTAANPQVVDYADQINDIYVNTDVPNSADCALVVRGDSMLPDYTNGSIVFYKRQEMVENGELAIVEIDGDGVTFKKVLFDYDNEQVILRSLNKKYDDRVLKDEEYRIIGKVVK